LGRNETSEAYYVYSDRHFGWIAAENVQLTLSSQPATAENVSEIENPRAVIGVENVTFGSREVLGLDIAANVDATATPVTPPATPATAAAPETPSAPVEATTFTGDINNDNPRIMHEFEGSAGQLVTITVVTTGGDLDTIVRLLDPSGTVISENDDHNQNAISLPNSRDSALVDVSLPSSGTYTVEVSRYNAEVGTTSGTFELVIGAGAAAVEEPTLVAPTVLLGAGTSVTENITDEQFELLYGIEAAANDTITVTAITRSGNLDPIIELYAPDGTLLYSNDDHDTNLIDLPNTRDSALVNVQLSVAGTYTLRVSRYNFAAGTTNGSIEIELTR
jgi:hypothetical protein